MKILNMWEHEKFGDAIGFLKYEKNNIEICGYYEGIEVGDELRSKMDSGKIGRFEVTKINYISNGAKGQFWGRVQPLGYLSNLILPDHTIITVN